MNQQQFNQFVEIYIKIQAAHKVFQNNYDSSKPFKQKRKEINQKKEIALERLNTLKENDKALDDKLTALEQDLHNVPNDDRGPYVTQNLYAKIGTQKALLQCEMLYLDNELSDLLDQWFFLLESPDFRGEAVIEIASKQAEEYRQILKKEMFSLWRSENPKIENPQILAFIEKDMLFTPDMELEFSRNFIDHLNIIFHDPFDYRITYRELLAQVAIAINDHHWTKSKDSSTQKKIQVFQEILAKQGVFPAENIYLELQKKAQQIGFNTSNKNLNTLCAGIIEKDPILIQSLIMESGILNEVDELFLHRSHTTEKENLAKKITPQFVQRVEQQEFSHIIDLYLYSQAGQQIAKETVASVQNCIKETHALAQQILQLENEYQRLIELQKKETEKLNNFQNFLKGLEDKPMRDTERLYQKILKQYEDDLYITEYQICATELNLKNKRKEYNHFITDHHSVVYQAIVLSQFAAQFEKQYREVTGHVLRKVSPQNANIDNADWTKMLHGFVIAKGTLPDSLSHFMHTTKSDYEMSYSAFAQKLQQIVNHPHWIKFKQNQGDTRGVEELARILNNLGHPGAKKNLSLIQNTAAKYIKSSSTFFSKGPAKENYSAVLYRAIVEKDISSLDKLLIKFDFYLENDERISLNLQRRDKN